MFIVNRIFKSKPNMLEFLNTLLRNTDPEVSCYSSMAIQLLSEISESENCDVAERKSQKMDIKLQYDTVNMKFTNLPEAINLFHYEYRKGWS